MMKRAWAYGTAGLVLLMLCAAGDPPAHAQILSGSLSGKVVDETGALVSGADVTLTNEASKDVRRTKTNSEGFFTFASIPPG
ncbi:MAG TPA: carboxypeptidase-like regulatory domain-containing protein, partial [Vicinamibacteria bacterium]|nr:carboxypeptidase-like regulatory domain-containing protein [Vicinamibacteria bacterium]